MIAAVGLVVLLFAARELVDLWGERRQDRHQGEQHVVRPDDNTVMLMVEMPDPAPVDAARLVLTMALRVAFTVMWWVLLWDVSPLLFANAMLLTLLAGQLRRLWTARRIKKRVLKWAEANNLLPPGDDATVTSASTHRTDTQ